MHKMLTFQRIIIIAAIHASAMACYGQLQPGNQDKGLKDYYNNFFPVGVAVSPRALMGEEGRFIVKQFNSLTPENAMKMGIIHPGEHIYHFKDADSIVAFAV